MAGELPRQAIFLDTSLIVAATIEAHPSHARAATFVNSAIGAGSDFCISPQVCREFLVVLTRQPVSDRIFTLEEALGALEIWTADCRLLPENQELIEIEDVTD